MRKLLVCTGLSLVTLLSFAQPSLHLSAEDKLSNNTISSICEDALGRIWMATKSGVDRFDGYDIEVLYHDPTDENTIQSNLVNKVYRDWRDDIWICNANGLAFYDHASDLVCRCEVSLKSVENIIQVSADRYLLCSQSSSVLYDRRDGTCAPFEPDCKPFVFYNAEMWRDGFIFCTSAHNLEFISFSPDGGWKRMTRPIHFDQSQHGVIFDSRGNILTDAFGKGLWKIDPVTFEKTLVRIDGLPADRIECLCTDTAGRVWLGTKSGLLVYDPSTAVSYSANADTYGILPYDTINIRTLFKDSRSNIWIGTDLDGVICRLSVQRSFNTIMLEGAESGRNNVTSLGYDPADSTLWIGTQSGGVYRMTSPLYIPDHAANILTTSSICFSPSCPSSLFVASSTDGVYSVDRKSGRASLACRASDILVIYPASGGRIWAGSLSGLYLADPATGSYVNAGLFSDNSRHSVTALMTDSDGFLWVGCREGLYRCKVGEGAILRDSSGPGMSEIMRVQALLQSSDGTVWIGTSDGLMSFSGGELNGLVPEPALRGRSIKDMREGDEGQLWITTDYGLFLYDYNKPVCSAFYASDGLPSHHFTAGPIASCGKGLCVGGRGGVSLFTPGLMVKDTVTVKPFVSRLLVHNREVHPGDGSRILQSPVETAGNMVIRHNQNAFCLQFTCPDFSASGNNVFWYRMDGFDEDWIRSDNRTATYTNLRKGRYVFRVRCANTSGVLCPDEAAIRIRVRPAWYGTNAFFVFILLLVAFGICRLVLYIVRRAEENNVRKLNEMQRKYEEKLRYAKLASYLIPDYAPTADEEDMLVKFLGRIEEGISDPALSVEALASYMCMSRCNLHLKVKRLTGSSPIDLIKRLRIEKACGILRQGGDLSLADVAERSGFSSTSYFCSAFKKATGYTPKEYVSRK